MTTDQITGHPASSTLLTTATATAFAGLAYAVDGLLQLRHTQRDHGWTAIDYGIEVVFTIALLASVLALEGLPKRLRLPRLGALAARVAQAGFAAMAIASVASTVAGTAVALGPLLGIGLLLVVVGLLAVAISGLWAGRARWVACLPFAGMLLSIVLGDHGGSILAGAAWLLIAWRLMAQRAVDDHESHVAGTTTRRVHDGDR